MSNKTIDAKRQDWRASTSALRLLIHNSDVVSCEQFREINLRNQRYYYNTRAGNIMATLRDANGTLFLRYRPASWYRHIFEQWGEELKAKADKGRKVVCIPSTNVGRRQRRVQRETSAFGTYSRHAVMENTVYSSERGMRDGITGRTWAKPDKNKPIPGDASYNTGGVSFSYDDSGQSVYFSAGSPSPTRAEYDIYTDDMDYDMLSQENYERLVPRYRELSYALDYMTRGTERDMAQHRRTLIGEELERRDNVSGNSRAGRDRANSATRSISAAALNQQRQLEMQAELESAQARRALLRNAQNMTITSDTTGTSLSAELLDHYMNNANDNEDNIFPPEINF